MGAARCPANQFLHDRVRQALALAELQQLDNAAFGYRRALRSLEAYPVPVLCLRQAAALEGVGMKLLAVLDAELRARYAPWLREPPSRPVEPLAPEPPRKRVNPATPDAVEPREAEVLARMRALEAEHPFRRYFGREEIGLRRRPARLLEAMAVKGLLLGLDFDGQARYRLPPPDEPPRETARAAPAPPSPPPTAENSREAPGASLPAQQIIAHRLYINIDNRERNAAHLLAFEEKLAMNGLRVKRRNLPLGDFLWTAEVDCEGGSDEYLLGAIVERKTADDLARSVVDGRFRDQCARLRACGLPRRYLLVEGATEGHAFSGLAAAIASARVCEGLLVLRGADAKASADCLTRIARGLEEELSRELSAGSVQFACSYSAFAKNQRRFSNLTVGNAAHNALRQIRGMGEETAHRVLRVYPTLAALSDAVQRFEGTEQEELRGLVSAAQGELLIRLFARLSYSEGSFSQP